MILRICIPSWLGRFFISKRDRDNTEERAQAHGIAKRSFGGSIIGLEYTVERIDPPHDKPAP